MIINYQEEYFDENYQGELPSKIEHIKHDKRLIDYQIRLLQNRIGQLQNLESLQQKKIKNKHNKIHKFVDVHNFKIEMEQLKLQQQEQLKQKEEYHKIKAQTQRQQTTEQIQQLQELQLIQKKKTNMLTRQQRITNEQEVKIQKLQDVKEKQEKAKKVQEGIQKNQEKINEFWKKKLHNFGQKKLDDLRNFEDMKDDRYHILQKLVEYENIHIQKLQNSQKNIQKLDGLLKDQNYEKRKAFLSVQSTSHQKSMNKFQAN